MITTILKGVIVRGDITVTIPSQIQVAFKNYAPFTKCVTKIDGATTDLIMPMYNLREYSSNYSETTGILWFYSNNETSNFYNNIASTENFKSFKYNAKVLENTVSQSTPNAANEISRNATIAVPLIFGNYWKCH